MNENINLRLCVCLQVMANVVMEQLLPSLEKDMLPRLKAKKTEKKRVWFAVSHGCYSFIHQRDVLEFPKSTVWLQSRCCRRFLADADELISSANWQTRSILKSLSYFMESDGLTDFTQLNLK